MSQFRSRRALVGAAVAVAVAASPVAADQITGPSSSQAPFLVPVAGGPSFNVVSMLTAGDSVGGYTMAGTPDGVGAYDNGDGTMTMLVNHEFVTAAGSVRAHGGTGSFVSRWVVSTTPGANFLQVLGGGDLDQSVVTNTAGAGTSAGIAGATATAFNRFCSADLAPVSAFYDAATGAGTRRRIYLNGEESGSAGRAMAHVVDVNGSHTGVGYQLNAFDNLAAWENLLANPGTGAKTLVMGDSDGGTRNGVYAYVGTKQTSGTDVERAGLTNGKTYGITVTANGAAVAAETRDSALATAGNAVLSGRFGLSEIARDASGAVTGGNVGTTFLRPEDGAWDASHPSDYYFVTTDRYDETRDGVGSQVGRSRLWRMRYDDVNSPTAGGSIEAVLDGTEGQQMLDNITVVPGVDGHTRVLALEDVGNTAHNGKVWLYDATTDSMTLVAAHFAKNGDVGVAPTAPYNVDEEFSGIIDARDTLGLGWFLLVDQQHYALPNPTVEGGQMLAFYLPSAVPEPTAICAVLASLPILTLRRRRA